MTELVRLARPALGADELAQVARVQLRPEPVDLGAMAVEILGALRAGEPGRAATFRIAGA